MSNPEFKALLRKYNAGNCTEEEKTLIETWYLKFEVDDPVELSQEQINGILAMQVPVQIKPQKKQLWKWVGAAAAILVVLSTGIYLKINNAKVSEQVVSKEQTDVDPGVNKAILTLATGKKILLEDAKNGVLTSEDNATIRKTGAGQVEYLVADNQATTAILLNTMTTPRGGQYHLILADGTKVWLNAASSITYPIRFAGKERKIEITGEAYLEVAHLADQPFHVVSRGQDVEVLGTHFNVNAYADEPVTKTTLLEGSVRITAEGHTKILKPGEQAILSSTGLKMSSADIDETMAWHEGDFVFNSQTLEEIMRTVSRWYDVDVDYTHYKFNKQTFTGVVSRSRKLSAVINTIKKSMPTLKFDIHGKKVAISN
ncbi:ferric-dicitrate binding protein FerR (iron transport regulator) [Pedobacter sp. AK017]|uniref:FecR family protein n=1 Tax=Pedobacter sp. AK017 TaxID=2723073 RepID=UPI001617D4B2|nr:FecR family protein [Pedobacter sp. AK017]MBB5436924.1 ferric-dicitrate binding protein FerR (iron transport regulator) [Pedobacter sp. AK017]